MSMCDLKGSSSVHSSNIVSLLAAVDMPIFGEVSQALLQLKE